MSKFFVPYAGETPAAIDIKGHRLLILSASAEDMFGELKSIGGDEVRELELHEDDTAALAGLAESVKGGVVLTPPGITVSAMIHDLERELPWIH